MQSVCEIMLVKWGLTAEEAEETREVREEWYFKFSIGGKFGNRKAGKPAKIPGQHPLVRLKGYYSSP